MTRESSVPEAESAIPGDFISSELPREMYDSCGVVATVSPELDAGKIACTAVINLENRGRHSTGATVMTKDGIAQHRDFGIGEVVFPDGGIAFSKKNPGNQALAHARYPTQGVVNSIEGSQPYKLNIETLFGNLEISSSHNGNLVNTCQIADFLGLPEGSYNNDSELFNHAFAYGIELFRLEHPDEPIKLAEIARQVVPIFEGSFTTAIMIEGETLVFCDRNGVKPAVIGKRSDGGMIVASEVTALDAVDATFIREMEPGEMVSLKTDGSWSAEQWTDDTTPAGCLMELLYFQKPRGKNGTEAVFRGVNVEFARYKVGHELANITPVKADLVFGIPNSAVPAGRGYADATKGTEYEVSYYPGLVAKNTAKTFIMQNEVERRKGVRGKIEVDPNVAGKRCIVVDDSLVRGTTTTEVVKMLREAGAAEVHIRIAMSMHKFICFLGTDIPDRDQLAAANSTVEEICKSINADSLAFLPEEKLKKSLGSAAARFCMGCLTGEYPVEPSSGPVRVQLTKRPTKALV